MSTIIINWKFKGSSGNPRVYKIQSPCTVSQLRTHLKEATGLHTTPSLDILLSFEDKPEIVLSDNLHIFNKSNIIIQRMRSEEAKLLMDEANLRYKTTPTNNEDVCKNTINKFKSNQHTHTQTMNGSTPTHNNIQPSTHLQNNNNNHTQSTIHTHLSTHKPSHSNINNTHYTPIQDNISNITTNHSKQEPIITTPTHTHDHLTPYTQDNNPSIHTHTTIQQEEADEDQKISVMMAQHGDHRGPIGYTQANEGLGQRYYRNRNLKWNAADQQDHHTHTFNNNNNTIPSSTHTHVFKIPNNYTSSSSTIHTPNYTNTHTSNNYNNTTLKISNDYICHLCGNKGHHIRNCPNSHSHKHYKKIKPATGIPNNFFTPISTDDIANYNEVYIMKDGTYAIMRDVESVSARAYFSKSVKQRVQIRLGNSDPNTSSADNFKCALCHKLFINPVVTPCCGETFCSNCIHTHLVNCTRSTPSKINPCPVCGETINLNQLTPNKAVKEAVDAILKNSTSHSKSFTHTSKRQTHNNTHNASTFNKGHLESIPDQARTKRVTSHPIKISPIKRIKSEIQ